MIRRISLNPMGEKRTARSGATQSAEGANSWRRISVVALLLTLLVAACGDDDASPNPEAFCSANAAFADAGDFLDTSPEEASRVIPEVRGILESGLSSAPDEVRGSFRTLVDAFTPLLDVFEDSNYGASEVDQPALEAALLGLASTDVQEANSAVEAWIDANC